MKRNSIYDGCTRDDIVSILYPNGRSASTKSPPFVGALVETPSKGLGAFTKRIAAIFCRSKTSKTDKPKEPLNPVALVPEPMSSVVPLEVPQLIFDADLEVSMWEEANGQVGSKRVSKSAEALSLLIDAHSDEDTDSPELPREDSVLADILDSFPAAPTLPPAPAAPKPALTVSTRSSVNTGPAVNIVADGFISNGKIIHVSRSATSRRNVSIGIGSKRSAAASTPVFGLRPAR
jgi:hypothetical protein